MPERVYYINYFELIQRQFSLPGLLCNYKTLAARADCWKKK